MNPWSRRCSPAVAALGQALPVIRSLEHAGFLRKATIGLRGDGRPALRWDVNPGADWRSACGNCGNSTGPRGALHTADWWSACANCGNPHRTVTCSSPQPGGEQDADLDLDHVESEGVFCAVVEFQAEQDAMHHIKTSVTSH
jgi:hypothetical protein